MEAPASSTTMKSASTAASVIGERWDGRTGKQNR
jgi:hypothetical protein